jgi:hypothetical protein
VGKTPGDRPCRPVPRLVSYSRLSEAVHVRMRRQVDAGQQLLEACRQIPELFGSYSACPGLGSRRGRIGLSWTESLGPRPRIRDHGDAQKWASELQRFRAAYRNRTDDLRITRVSPCVAPGLKARANFMFAGGCWCRSLVVDGRSGASRGHASVMRRPGSRWSGAVGRPSAFQAGHIPSWRGSCGCYALMPVAGGGRWPLLLLSAGVTVTGGPAFCRSSDWGVSGLLCVCHGGCPMDGRSCSSLPPDSAAAAR